MAGDASRKNGQKGGRKPGSKNKANIERDAAIKVFRQKVANNAETLFATQFGLARGATYLFRIDKEWVATSQTNKDKGYYRNKKPVLVSDPNEMMLYLEELADNNGDIADDKDESSSYYFMVGKDPDNHAIDSLLDRTFGRSKTELEVQVKLPKPIFGGLAILTLPEGMKQLPPKKVKGVVIPNEPQKQLKA